MFTKIFSAVICILFVLMPVSNLFSQDMDKESEQNKVWMEYMTPGWAHEMMKKHEGNWKTVNTFWMDPSADSTVVVGNSKIEMILGGRYMKATHKGVMMGMPFEGIELDGYDNAKKEFTSVWIDNMGTGIAVSHGKYDKSTKTITYTGSMYDPMAQKDVDVRQTVDLSDDNQIITEMFVTQADKEVKVMHIEMTRE